MASLHSNKTLTKTAIKMTGTEYAHEKCNRNCYFLKNYFLIMLFLFWLYGPGAFLGNQIKYYNHSSYIHTHMCVFVCNIYI